MAIPVRCELCPDPVLVEDGVEPDVLGLFVGNTHAEALAGESALPPQILLFVESLWDQAEASEPAYRTEVRLTYLHELGHYFGWDEEEVARRGLE